jgi:hypothetical protein
MKKKSTFKIISNKEWLKIRFLNFNNRKIVCKILDSRFGEVDGIARLNPEDDFNEATGMQLAFERAEIKLKKKIMSFHRKLAKEIDTERNKYLKVNKVDVGLMVCYKVPVKNS